MNKIFTLSFSLIICLGAFAQKIDYDNSSKWYLGLNLGGTWQTTDVANRTSAGAGLTLGRSFNYNYGRRLVWDLRARYLRGYWYGQDYDSTSLAGYSGTPLQAYKDSLGFTVNNFQADVHRLSLELVLHANGVRERTGWDPYIFGGIGFTWYQTFGDLLDQTDSIGIYNYEAASLNKPYVNGLLDGIYDSPLEGASDKKYTIGVMPSLGFGIGYQVGKRVTLGLEHKTTFTLVDNFDGYTDASSRKNDIYHYTSLFVNFRFRHGSRGGGGNSVGNVDNYNNNTNNLTNTGCISPVVTYLTPSAVGTSVSTVTYKVTAEIRDLIGRENIVFKQNGVSTLNFSYNPQTDRFESDVVLISGTNTFEITATNTCGSDVETITLNYQPCQSPSVIYTSPVTQSVSVSNTSYVINADVYHITARENITFKVNGLVSSNFVFNPQTGKFESTVSLVSGVNTFEITATNACGTDTRTVTINQVACPAPVITYLSPSTTGTTVNTSTLNLSAQVLNVPSNQSISIKVNNRSVTNFSYNAANGGVQTVLNLVPGTNTIVITATNNCGTDTETITVNYVQCIAPSISVSNPAATGTTVTAALFTMNGLVQQMTSSQGLTVSLNGQSVNNFTFTPNTGALRATLGLVPGVNTVVISATNNCGTDTETFTITYQDCTPPSILVTNPSMNGTTVNSASFNLTASIQNMTSTQGITLSHNGRPVNGFSFTNGAFSSAVTLNAGLNTFVITVVNGCGTDTETITVKYERQVDNGGGTPEQKITICHYPPGNNGNPQTLEIPLSAWPAHQAHGDKLGPCPAEDNNNGGGNGNSGNNGGGNNEQKITICHYPPGNNGNPQTLEIPLSAWPAHQAHGDKLGPCPAEDNNNGGGNGNSGNNGGGNGNGNNGHGNNEDGVDSSNPGQGNGGPNGQPDASGTVDDEGANGNQSGGAGGNASGNNGGGNASSETGNTQGNGGSSGENPTNGNGQNNGNGGAGTSENSGNSGNNNFSSGNGSSEEGNGSSEGNSGSGSNGSGNGQGNSGGNGGNGGGNKSSEQNTGGKPAGSNVKKPVPTTTTKPQPSSEPKTEEKPASEGEEKGGGKPAEQKPQSGGGTPAGKGKN